MIRILDWIQLDIFGPNHSGWGAKGKKGAYLFYEYRPAGGF